MTTHFLCLSGVLADSISLDWSRSLGCRVVRASDGAEGPEVMTFIYSLTHGFLFASLWGPPPALSTHTSFLQELLKHLLSVRRCAFRPKLAACAAVSPLLLGPSWVRAALGERVLCAWCCVWTCQGCSRLAGKTEHRVFTSSEPCPPSTRHLGVLSLTSCSTF